MACFLSTGRKRCERGIVFSRTLCKIVLAVGGSGMIIFVCLAKILSLLLGIGFFIAMVFGVRILTEVESEQKFSDRVMILALVLVYAALAALCISYPIAPLFS